jgi:uncharacterized damage-inducible protein DinB
MHLTVEELIHYTDEERARWEKWFGENGEDLLKMPLTGDRENSVGALVMHIFGPELRYIQRLKDEPLTEYRARPCSTVDQVFGFGLESRRALRDYVLGLKPEDWARSVRLQIAGHERTATVRKIILHALLHEVRHWAQIARIMRERGFAPPGGHDLLMSEALF